MAEVLSDVVIDEQELFPPVKEIDSVAMNILKKRYFARDETTWEQVANRVNDWIMGADETDDKYLMRQLLVNRYFIPNSPCLVNAGKEGG